MKKKVIAIAIRCIDIFCKVILVTPLLFFGLVIYSFFFGGLFNYLFQGVWYFCTGWIVGVYRLLVGLAHEPVAIVIGMLALLVLPFMLHLLIRRLPGRKRVWRFRQSVAITGIACAFIITTIALIAAIHEFYWIGHPKEPLLGPRIISTLNILKDGKDGSLF
jgi:hypothetical protein